MRGNGVRSGDLTEARRFDRRSFLGLAGAALAAGAGTIAVIGGAGLAHDDHATPGASPVASPQASPAAAAAAPAEFSISTVDLAFQPSSLTIPARTDVTIRIENLGVIPHDFAIPQLGVKSAVLSNGESTTVTINAAPGTYGFACSVPGHKQAGMRGTLVVL